MGRDITCPECGGLGYDADDPERLPCDFCDGFGRVDVEDI